MAERKRKAYSDAEKRKAIAIFLSLCVAVAVVVALLVFLIAFFKSGSNEEEMVKTIRVFTNLGYVGPNGPSGTEDYEGTVLEKEVALLNGIQLWTVPFAGVWYFEILGAAGSDGLYGGHNGRFEGGRGANVTGTLKLNRGQQLKILVGQQGTRDHLVHFRAGSGGGGTFVSTKNNKPLMVAGGGGGGGVPRLGRYTKGGDGKGMSTDGDGKGGILYDPQKNITVRTIHKGHSCMAGAGGGFGGNGAGYLKGWGGKAFIHGGKGGKIKKKTFSVRHGTFNVGYDKGGADGGFGGGGASGTLPGGGGGFTGGSVKGAYMFDKVYKHADGGSSYNIAKAGKITPGVHKNHGRVLVKFLGEEELTADKTSDPRIPKNYEDWYAK